MSLALSEVAISEKKEISDCRFMARSGGREEVDGLADGQRLDVGRLEADQAYTRDDLLLQFGVVELTRNHAAHGDLTRRRDGEFQHQLARKLRLIAQRAAVQCVEGTLVPVEHDLDFLACTRGLAAGAGALHAPARVRVET